MNNQRPTEPRLISVCDFTTVADIKRGGFRFDFSEMFGPLFLHRSTGEPLKNQPMPDRRSGARAWAAFEDWHREYRKAKK